MDPNSREFDITIFGATGYQGKINLQYMNDLVTKKRVLPRSEEPIFHLSQLRVAVAGRDEAKLRQLVSEVCPRLNAKIVIADVRDEASIYRMASNSRVVLNLVGPYEDLGGEIVIKACVSHGTDYLDITGEAKWINSMISRYDRIARQNGVLLIPFCGHDCVPTDLAGWFALTQCAQSELSKSHAALQVCVRMPVEKSPMRVLMGGPTAVAGNGTVQTVLNLAQDEAALETPLFPSMMMSGSSSSSSSSRPIDGVNNNHHHTRRLPSSGVCLTRDRRTAFLVSEFLPDAFCLRLSQIQSLGLEGKPGGFETKVGLETGNRLFGYAARASLLMLPKMLRIPGLAAFLKRRLNAMGSGPVFPHPDGDAMNYEVTAYLDLYDLSSSSDKIGEWLG